MSHTVTIDTEVRDPQAIELACHRLALPKPVFGETRLFSELRTGWNVQLPEWRYPVVCDVGTGRVDFDNFGGRWGPPHQLDRFVQTYAVEKTRLEARRRGHTVAEQSLADGSIKLTVQVGGAV
jgi:hypothetical protein